MTNEKLISSLTNIRKVIINGLAKTQKYFKNISGLKINIID
jgi:hypothetical protein